MATISGTNTNTSSTTSNSSQIGLAANFETFMKLLTAQLQSQDPLSPMDTKDFTNQLVQFTGVEQQLKTNDLLTTLTQSLSLNAGAMAVSYLGKQAIANTPLAGIVDGKAKWDYVLPQAASDISLNIYDKNNKLVATVAGEKTTGAHTFEWDGTTSGGTKLTDGQYRLEVKATNASGTAINATLKQTGIITNVDMSGSEPMVRIGGADIALTLVNSLSLPSN